MIVIDNYIQQFSTVFAEQKNIVPWQLTSNLPEIISNCIAQLCEEYSIENSIAIHKTAVVEAGVTLKGPIIISKNCFIGANAYLRNAVFLAESVKIGPGCEIKTSIIFSNTTMAHFNFIGDSLIGSNVNFEAGALIANHYNERNDKKIKVCCDLQVIETGVEKFGALVGDHSRIGANAVLSPGTIIKPGTVVKRLELIEQV
jgi:UDP-N-acetylglucosamine diphosphorylase / glucose-1-phosphate thymidylyltransferase / UDP-N-acetylgalactosamine diphosphorylase / glucosamine-1-phosphate N-acetyltransferase / galactosamine-1-phosphate N-acetyltransferase